MLNGFGHPGNLSRGYRWGSEMRACYLCGATTSLSQEHLWSQSVSRAFPNASLTISEHRGKVYSAAPTIGDVCKDCNSGMSGYDAYMGELARRHFVKPLPGNPISLDLAKLTRWLLKTAANHSRSLRNENEWWRKFTTLILSSSDRPAYTDFFGAPWFDPRPLELQQMLPVPALGGMSILLQRVENPPWTEMSSYFNVGWALKIGFSVFMFIDYKPNVPDSLRLRLCDSLREFGWALLGIDSFPRSCPFNQYTCVKFGIITDPTDQFVDISGADL